MDGVVTVSGGIQGAALDWPLLSFTGDWFRRVTVYNGKWYYEYILLSSGTLAAQQQYACDVFLIGGGGHGAASPGSSAYMYPSPGGGSGYPVSALGRIMSHGNHTVTVGPALDSSIALDLAVTAQKGGNASASASSSVVGSGYTQTYYLYGDSAYPAGVGGGASRGSGTPVFVIPGSGGGGCTMLPGIQPGPSMKRDSNSVRQWTPVVSGKFGFGAGAMGWASLITYNDQQYAQWDTTPAPGVVAIRIRVQ